MKRLGLLVVGSLVVACGSGSNDIGGALDGSADTPLWFGDSATDSVTADGSCDPPDMLVVLDRSDSMKKPPDGSDAGPSKWALAVAAIETITAPPIDSTLRYGLELLPDQACVKGDGGACGSGLMSIAVGLDNGPAIATSLSSTNLLFGTPIGGALAVAQTTLAGGHVDGRAQNIVLVTDGNETCNVTPPLPIVQSLASSGVHTYVVGFGGQADPALLNDLACAGLTASNFTTSCAMSGGGYVATVPSSTHVYFDAADGAALKIALSAIAGGACCSCVIPH